MTTTRRGGEALIVRGLNQEPIAKHVSRTAFLD
jgi:hypothetical protein